MGGKVFIPLRAGVGRGDQPLNFGLSFIFERSQYGAYVVWRSVEGHRTRQRVLHFDDESAHIRLMRMMMRIECAVPRFDECVRQRIESCTRSKPGKAVAE